MKSTVESRASVALTPVVPRRPVFLSARWEALVMINFPVDPALLKPLVPRGTELDFFGGVTYVSLVGFLFRQTRVLGLPIPWHIDFEEVNLRFYVQRTVGHELRRGVCFVRELVPRAAIARVARWFYNEPYLALPMRHTVDLEAIGRSDRAAAELKLSELRLSYEWRSGGEWHGLHVQTRGPKRPTEEGSLEQFIAEHYWGYCRQRDGGTVEYEVEHPPWNVWQAEPLAGPLVRPGAPASGVGGFYGDPWTEVLRQPASSTFVADGSAVKVFRPTRIA
jgi:uncharacterized protein YqjF (DUF2071 family)